MRLALELCDSTITYRTRYLGQLQPAPVLDLVMLDESNPRSLVFQLGAIEATSRLSGQASGVHVPALPGTFVRAGSRLGAVQPIRRRRAGVAPRGLALAMLRDIAADAERRLDQILGGDNPRLVQPRVPAAQTVGSSTA